MEQVVVTAKNDSTDYTLRKELATQVAQAAVSKAINEAIAWIESDPDEFFLYKYPRECEERIHNRLQVTRMSALEDTSGSTSSAKGRRSSVRAVTETSTKSIDWLRIDEFSLNQLVQLVYDYLGLWRLTPNTQYIVRLENDSICEEPHGSTYCLNALFARQPQHELAHSNPLTMAQVNFKVHVSHLLPKFYPIMMTYRFENCNRDYYAIGNRCMRRLDFQRFFIDMALETKFGFYAQLLKSLTFATELKFDDIQRGSNRKGGKVRERDGKANRLRSTTLLSICDRAESERAGEKSSREKESVVVVSEDEREKSGRAED